MFSSDWKFIQFYWGEISDSERRKYPQKQKIIGESVPLNGGNFSKDDIFSNLDVKSEYFKMLEKIYPNTNI